MIAEANLADLCMTHDLPGAEEHARAALALARRWGLRGDEALRGGQPHVHPHDGGTPRRGVPARDRAPPGRRRRASRGGDDQLQARSSGGASRQRRGRPRARFGCRAWAKSDDVQYRASYAAAEAAASLAEGDEPARARGRSRRDRRGHRRRLSASRTRRSGSPFPLPSRRRSTSATSRKPSGSPRLAGDAPTGRGPPVPPGAGHPGQGACRSRTR